MSYYPVDYFASGLMRLSATEVVSVGASVGAKNTRKRLLMFVIWFIADYSPLNHLTFFFWVTQSRWPFG
jgi:hypothetical protein